MTVEGFMSESLRSAVAAFVVVAGGMFAQSTATRPGFAEFEVASIKPTPPGAAGRWIRMQGAHEFTAKNHALKTLIAAAYNLNPNAISGGPAWVDSDRYDIALDGPGDIRMGETGITVGYEKMRDAEGKMDGKLIGKVLGYFSH